MHHRLFGIFLLCFSPATGFALETIFEGYYRIELQNKPIGYTVMRYEYEPKTSSFHALTFLRAKFGDQVVQESLKAQANDKFKPISYQYTSQVGDKVKMIDATFLKNDQMKLKISDGKKAREELYKNPKGTFLSSFLPFLLLQKKLELNTAFQYSAIAEEDGGSYNGKALMQSRESHGGYLLFTVLNRFKGEEFYSKMAIVKDPKDLDKNIKGEVFETRSPNKNLTTHLVSNAKEATEGQLVPNKTLIQIFGGMPMGKINLLTKPQESDEETGVIPAAVPPSPKPSMSKSLPPAPPPEQGP